MSFNISKKILAVADVTVRVSIADLTPRQQTAFRKYITTGFVLGRGVPAILAAKHMRQRNLMYLHRTYGPIVGMCCFNVSDSPMHEALRTAVAMSRIEGDTPYLKESLSRADEAITTAHIVARGGGWWRNSVSLHDSPSVWSAFSGLETGYEVPEVLVLKPGSVWESL